LCFGKHLCALLAPAFGNLLRWHEQLGSAVAGGYLAHSQPSQEALRGDLSPSAYEIE